MKRMNLSTSQNVKLKYDLYLLRQDGATKNCSYFKQMKSSGFELSRCRGSQN